MTALDPRTADKLAKIAALFGSDKVGERAAAAAMADKLIRSRGLTWQQIIVVPSVSAPRPTTVEQMIMLSFEHGHLLTAWEEGFLRGIRGRQHLTEKQLAKLDGIVAKVRRAAS